MLHPILALICLHSTMLDVTTVCAAALVTLDAKSFAASNTVQKFLHPKLANSLAVYLTQFFWFITIIIRT